MKVAMIGLGKLGLPVSCAMVLAGHQVYGYDIDEEKRRRYKAGQVELYEPDFDSVLRTALDSGLFIIDSLAEAVGSAEIIFIAVPTPSNLAGDFEIEYVKDALRAVTEVMAQFYHYQVIAVISTVLPGTTRNQFLPLVEGVLGPPGPDSYGFCYSAQFIAMGSVIHDFCNPEFMLIGEYDGLSGDILEGFYQQVNPKMRVFHTTIENAEIIKMAYNTFIGLKIVFANTVLELCNKIPNADADVVSNAFSLATDRLISDRYLKGGLGDGGPCHPRDQRALAWLAKELYLSADPFSFVSEARRAQTEYLADLIWTEQRMVKLPVTILGLTFKPETNLLDDSPALLLIQSLVKKGVRTIHTYDPVVKPLPLPDGPFVYVIATRWPEFKAFNFVPGSVVIDPWHMLNRAPEGCTWRPVGRSLDVLLPEAERVARYDYDYYMTGDCAEKNAYRRGALRVGDMGACLCYAYGAVNYPQVGQILNAPEAIFEWQVQRVQKHASRTPQLVVSIGAGRGELDAAFMRNGVRCIGIDPSASAAEIYAKTMREWAHVEDWEFMQMGALVGMKQLVSQEIIPDTVILCEALEHIPAGEWWEVWPLIKQCLRATSGLFIVANWIDFHPIIPDGRGWDHVQLVDDPLYHRLGRDAKQAIVHEGSHLVLQF